MSTTVTHITNAMQTAGHRQQSKPTPLYALIVVGEGLSDGLGGPPSNLLIFSFSMAPSMYSMEEPSAMSVTATPGGVYTEGQGQLIKNFNIEGTTGFRPHADLSVKSGGFANWRTAVTGIESALNNLRGNTGGLLPGETTGFVDFLRLRNLFRAYWDAKGDRTRASKTFMIWGNLRENEIYVVEPGTFTTRRDRGPLWRYSIPFKTIAPLFDLVELPADFIDSYVTMPTQSTFGKSLAFAQKVNQLLSASLMAVGDVIGSAAGQSEDAVRTLVLSPMQTLVRGARNIVNGVDRVVRVPANIITESATVLMSVREYYQSTALPQSPAAHALKNAVKSIEYAVVTFRDIAQGGGTDEKLIAQGTAYNKSVGGSTRSSTLVPVPTAPLLDAGSGTTPGSRRFGMGAGVDRVRGRETVKDAAQRLLGSRSYWRVLVTHNKLRYPYFALDGNGVDILRPNDPLYYPVEAYGDGGTASIGRTIDEQLGTDIALNLETDELLVSPTGDLALVSGVQNMQQAMHIKFTTFPGELPAHPTFGGAVRAGTREVLPQDAAGHLLSARMTLLSDRRVRAIPQLDVVQVGDVLNVRGVVQVGAASGMIDLDQRLSRRN